MGKWLVLVLLALAPLFLQEAPSKLAQPQTWEAKKPALDRIPSKVINTSEAKLAASDQSMLQQKWNQSLQEFSKQLEIDQIDAKEFIEKYFESGQQAALKDISPLARLKFENFAKQNRALQNAHLLADGRSRDFFVIAAADRPSPPKVDRRHQLALQYSGSSNLKTLLMSLEKKASIDEDDIEALADTCNFEKLCMEHSVVRLIDANHLLSDEQFRLIDDLIRN